MTDDIPWTTVRTAPNEWDAALIKQRLEEIDIPVLLEAGGAHAYLGASSPYAVRVPADRLEDAEQALR
jgi:hypothetical protein